MIELRPTRSRFQMKKGEPIRGGHNRGRREFKCGDGWGTREVYARSICSLNLKPIVRRKLNKFRQLDSAIAASRGSVGHGEKELGT